MVVSHARRWTRRVRKDLRELWEDVVLLWGYLWEKLLEILYRRTLPITQFLFSRCALARTSANAHGAWLEEGLEADERGGPDPSSRHACMHARNTRPAWHVATLLRKPTPPVVKVQDVRANRVGAAYSHAPH